MIKIHNKEYETILWDWRSTIYDPITEMLYPWVEGFLKTSDVKHILVSWSSNIPKREELINSFSISKKFFKVYITTNKKETFEQIFDLDVVNPETTLIIGDNVNDEILIAKELGVDSMHVTDFVKELHLAK